jgi:hypothetical protein
MRFTAADRRKAYFLLDGNLRHSNLARKRKTDDAKADRPSQRA